MIDELEIHRFILKFNKRNQDDWNPSNVNLRKMLAEFAEYAAQQSANVTIKKIDISGHDKNCALVQSLVADCNCK